MKDIVFHCDLSTSDSLEVTVDGEMVTKDQLGAVLVTLNNPHFQRFIAEHTNERLKREEKAGG